MILVADGAKGNKAVKLNVVSPVPKLPYLGPLQLNSLILHVKFDFLLKLK